MTLEKVTLFIRKLFWTLVFIAVIIFDLLLFFEPTASTAKIIKDSGSGEYYESLDSSTCEITLELDNYADTGSITVEFRDKDGKILSEEKQKIYVDILNKKASCTFNIDGDVKYYEIVDYNLGISDIMKYEVLGVLIFIELLTVLPIFISTILLSCKVYLYDDQKIMVYAGRYHNYIKVDGVKYDEFNTFSSRLVIYLSCTLDDGTYVDATITANNRITLKIDNKLYNNIF